MGLWVRGDDERGAEAAQEQGMILDSRPAPMVAALVGLLHFYEERFD